jgi:hypothetical protein
LQLHSFWDDMPRMVINSNAAGAPFSAPTNGLRISQYRVSGRVVGWLEAMPRTRKKQSRRNVRYARPEEPIARDEGPRLLPLEEKNKSTESRLEHYTELADIALGNEPKQR